MKEEFFVIMGLLVILLVFGLGMKFSEHVDKQKIIDECNQFWLDQEEVIDMNKSDNKFLGKFDDLLNEAIEEENKSLEKKERLK